MVNPEIIRYLKDAEAKGYSEAELREWLRKNGYIQEHIDEAFYEIDNPPIKVQRSSRKSAITRKKEEYRISYRKPWMVLLLWFATAGFYSYYWFYVTTQELRKNGKKAPSVVLLYLPVILGSIIGILLLSQSELVEPYLEGLSSSELIEMIVPVSILITIILSIIAILYFYWKYCKALQSLSKAPKFGTFLLMVFAQPIGLVLAQVELNNFT